MLANDAYWLMHNDVTGSLQTSKRAADLVVASAMLAELIGERALAVGTDRIAVYRTDYPLDGLGNSVCEQILAVPELGPSEVLDGLAPGIRKRVADRLVENGEADWRGGLFRKVAVARDGDVGPAWVRGKLANSVVRGLPLSDQHRFLLRLLQHSSMDGNPLAGINPNLVNHALQQVDPARDPYAALLSAATAALRVTAVTR